MFCELQGCRWDVILVSETWRSDEEEIWESKQGHTIMCAGKFENKHGVAIIVNKKWKHKINWTKYISERAIATSITVNKQHITLMSVYMPHSGYADHLVEKAYNMIEKVIKPTNHMQIIGGDFNAKLGPGIGVERTSVGQHTLLEAKSRGDWMKQWLMTQRLVALNTMYRKAPGKPGISKPLSSPLCLDCSLQGEVNKVMRKTFEEIILKNGQPALSLHSEHVHSYFQVSDKFSIHGPQGNAEN